MTSSTPNPYDSSVIRSRLVRRLNDKTIEEFVGAAYARDVTECLNILDIEYPVTAIGVLGRALENCTKEYCEKLLKSKTMFSINSANLPVSNLRKLFLEATQKDRLDLLNQQLVTKNKNQYQLKKKYLTNPIYSDLIEIKDARNDAFHGLTDEEDYLALESESFILIEKGILILVSLIENTNKLNRSH